MGAVGLTVQPEPLVTDGLAEVLQVLDGLAGAEIGKEIGPAGLAHTVLGEVLGGCGQGGLPLRGCGMRLAAVQSGRGLDALQAAGGAHAALVEEDDIEMLRERGLEGGGVAVGGGQAGGARPAGDGDEHPLPLARRRQHSEDHVDRPGLSGVEVIERHGQRDAGEVAVRARRASQTFQDSRCRFWRSR